MKRVSQRFVEALNHGCYCVGTDLDALRNQIESDLRERGLDGPIVASHPHLFAAVPVFVSPQHTQAMQTIIRAIEAVVALPSWQALALADAPAIAQHAQRTLGVFMGYDFHIGSAGPQLIEINTNAGGAFLNATIGSAQRACCAEVADAVSMPNAPADIEDAIFAMFRDEWQRARGALPLQRVAIVDSAPQAQYLYPEFLLAQRLFESHGVNAVIADPATLEFDGGHLLHEGKRIDLVYNRLTDFYLEAPEHALLNAAYAADAAVFTPHPRAHALFANKHNLATLTDSALLQQLGVAPEQIAILIAGIPRTVAVRAEDSERLWQDRKHWFFKPASGFGSRGAYRGDKLTHKTFAAILAGDYVAQTLSPPGERHLDKDQALKIDLRNYTYDGSVQLVAARLYQGQTTNFRTPGGGFAPVYHPPVGWAERIPACAPSPSGLSSS